MKNSIVAKGVWVRKTYCQKVALRPEDIEVLTKVNTTLVKLWNLAIEQIGTWLDMPSYIDDTRYIETGVYVEDITTQADENLEIYKPVVVSLERKKKNPDKPSITPITLNFWLTGARAENPDLGQISVVLEREMLRRLAGGFSSYFALLKKKDKRARPPSMRDPENSFVALTWTEKSFSINNSHLVATVGSGQKVQFFLGDYIQGILKDLPQSSKVAQVTISKRDDGYWANFVCNIPKPAAIESKKIIAIDLGAGDIVFSCSDGREFSFAARRPDKKWRKEIQDVEKRMDACLKGSRAWKRRTKARQVMHRKSLHQHTDHQRKLANWLVKQQATFVVGKMKTRLGLSQSEGTAEQHWGVQNTGYAFRLLLFLKEKVAERGLSLIEFPDPAREGNLNDPSSKFNASRTLLKQGCEKLQVSFPAVFKRLDFSFPQGG